LEATGFRVARGAVAEPGCRADQGWSAAADRARAGLRGPLPTGWTPLRELLGEQTRKGEGRGECNSGELTGCSRATTAAGRAGPGRRRAYEPSTAQRACSH